MKYQKHWAWHPLLSVWNCNLVSEPSMANPNNDHLFNLENPNLNHVITKTTFDSAYVKKNPYAYEVRSRTCFVGNPPFANLLNHVTSIKMDSNNFLLWQNIALPILRSYKLEGYLTGKDVCPKHYYSSRFKRWTVGSGTPKSGAWHMVGSWSTLSQMVVQFHDGWSGFSSH